MKKIKLALNKIIYAGTDTLFDHEKQRRISIGVNGLSLLIAGINATVGIFSYFITKNTLLLTGVIIEIFLMPIPILLNYYKKYHRASLVFYLIICAATLYFCCILEKLVEVKLTVIYLIGVAMFLFSDKISRAICILACLLVVILAEQNLRYHFLRPMEADDQVAYFMRWAAYLVIIFLVAFIFDLYARYIQKYARQMQISLKKEEKENQKKDKFIRNATHEIRVSFHSIFAIINILYKVEKKPRIEDLKQSIDDLRAACRISKSIIDNILEYEKYEAGLRTTTLTQLLDIRMLLSGIIDIYKYLADERMVKINCFVADEIPQIIVGDEIKLRQIVTNLLHNAIKFTHSNTNVSIRLEAEGDKLLLSVGDQGDGVRNKNTDTIFEPFESQNPDGLGLGLYIVKELVASLKGKITVTSDPASGALFTITIPLQSKIGDHSSRLLLN